MVSVIMLPRTLPRQRLFEPYRLPAQTITRKSSALATLAHAQVVGLASFIDSEKEEIRNKK
jgi:hypothetical protein